jgi:PAS domain S-box-containing protein
LSKNNSPDTMVRVEDVMDLLKSFEKNNLSKMDLSKNKELSPIVQKLNELAQKNNEKEEIGTIFDIIPALIGQWDQNFLNLHANQAYSGYFGKTIEEIKGLHIKDLLGPDLFEKNLSFMKQVLEGHIQTFEREIPLPNGGIKNTIATYLPNLVNGVIEGFFVIVTDISEVKEKSRDVFNQKQFYSDILNSMHEGFAIQNKDGKIIYFNKSAATILGLTEDQLVGKTSLDAGWQAIKEDGSEFLGPDHPAMQTIKTGKAQKDVIMGIKTPDNETRWLTVSSIPFSGQYEDEEACVLVTFSNMTTQFQKDKMISGVLFNSPGMIYQFKMTKEGAMSFPFLSPKAFDIYEVTPEAFEEDPSIMISMVIETDREGLESAIIQSAETGEPFEWKGRILANGGKLKWVSAKSIPHKEHDGSVIWDGILIDITHEIKMQEELAYERARAAHSARLAALGVMSASMAHEINNPLTIISGMSRLLARSFNEPEKYAQKVSEIDKSVERIAKIVKGLKRFASVDLESNRDIHNIDTIIGDMKTFIELKSELGHIDLQVEISSQSPILCDTFEIEQVIMNLVNNSLHAVQNIEKGWVKIHIFDRGSDVIIRVSDAGPGIPDSIVSKIFDPFFTTKKSEKALDWA